MNWKQETNVLIDLIEIYYKKGIDTELPNKLINDIEVTLEEQAEEIERLNNIINEIKKGLDKFYKEHSRLMWSEEDYIEFINCIDRELKGSDKE